MKLVRFDYCYTLENRSGNARLNHDRITLVMSDDNPYLDNCNHEAIKRLHEWLTGVIDEGLRKKYGGRYYKDAEVRYSSILCTVDEDVIITGKVDIYKDGYKCE